ncbi:LacI family DNA-binding transcriptional regulator [Actinopolymorpha sp. B17G11]|uniref:LacI family DNA-binding transcriptional regulator n=1 Tax=unclassified Actinopolymorpha TaxID=2627063 RepID=UPI0032E43C8F
MPGRPAVNMKDLAREAGVSVASVSRALSDAPGVSSSTRRRIKELAASMSYTVSPDASRLKRGSRNRVAVVVRDIAHWAYSSMLQGIMGSLRNADLDVLLYQVRTEQERRRFFEQLPARRQVDAVIVIAFPISDEERQCLELMDAAVVIAGGRLGDYPSVHIDDVAAAQQATNHLILAGHERIGMINAGGDWSLPYSQPADRLHGFTTAMEAAGLSVIPELIVEAPWGRTGGAEGMNRLLSIAPPPTAVFAFSDEVAIGALRSLRRAAVTVPSGMSVVGIDDHPMAELSDLTTVHQAAEGQGARAGQLLLDILGDNAAPGTQITTPTHLVVRGTTAPPRPKRPQPADDSPRHIYASTEIDRKWG